MTATLKLPENIDENSELTQLLLNAGVSPEIADGFADALQIAYENPGIREVMEKYGQKKEGKMKKTAKNCIFKAVIANIKTGSKITPKTCAGTIAHQIETYSPSYDPSAVFKQMTKYATTLASYYRVKRNRFLKHKHTIGLIDKYKNLNPASLEYLHIMGKLDLTADDFETLETFLELMIKKDENTKS